MRHFRVFECLRRDVIDRGCIGDNTHYVHWNTIRVPARANNLPSVINHDVERFTVIVLDQLCIVGLALTNPTVVGNVPFEVPIHQLELALKSANQAHGVGLALSNATLCKVVHRLLKPNRFPRTRRD